MTITLDIDDKYDAISVTAVGVELKNRESVLSVNASAVDLQGHENDTLHFSGGNGTYWESDIEEI